MHLALAGSLLSTAAVRDASSADGFARLHVTALSLSSDRRRVGVGEPFHVTIHLHVTERIGEPANLFLPDLTNCEIQGAERRTVATASGTDYRETLTLWAQHEGTAHLTPARLLAINARNGIASQFASNDLTIPVVPAAAYPTVFAAGATFDVLRRLAIAGVVLAIAALGIAIAFLRMRRPAAVALAAPVSQPLPPPAVRDRGERLRDALAELARGRTRSGALDVRAHLFDVAGAPPGATLRDALAGADGTSPSLRSALCAAERAAFADGPRREAAIDELLHASESVVRGL